VTAARHDRPGRGLPGILLARAFRAATSTGKQAHDGRAAMRLGAKASHGRRR
jgi:hypothetical protein